MKFKFVIFLILIISSILLITSGCTKLKKASHYGKINFTEYIEDDFLASLQVGNNSYFESKFNENKSYLLNEKRVPSNWKEYIFWFWVNGPKEDRTAEGADFIVIEIADISDASIASEKFDEVYKKYIEEVPEWYTTKPSIIEKYTDLYSEKAFYDYHYEQDNEQFKNKYGATYIFTVDNIYILVKGVFFDSNSKDSKNEIIFKVGEKVRNLINESVK